jgi:hypothetical protein
MSPVCVSGLWVYQLREMEEMKVHHAKYLAEAAAAQQEGPPSVALVEQAMAHARQQLVASQQARYQLDTDVSKIWLIAHICTLATDPEQMHLAIDRNFDGSVIAVPKNVQRVSDEASIADVRSVTDAEAGQPDRTLGTQLYQLNALSTMQSHLADLPRMMQPNGVVTPLTYVQAIVPTPIRAKQQMHQVSIDVLLIAANPTIDVIRANGTTFHLPSTMPRLNQVESCGAPEGTLLRPVSHRGHTHTHTHTHMHAGCNSQSCATGGATLGSLTPIHASFPVSLSACASCAGHGGWLLPSSCGSWHIRVASKHSV